MSTITTMGGPSKPRASKMEDCKEKLRARLNEIHEERNGILEYLDQIKAKVDSIMSKAESVAEPMLAETSPQTFFQHLSQVNCEVQACLDEMVLKGLQIVQEDDNCTEDTSPCHDVEQSNSTLLRNGENGFTSPKKHFPSTDQKQKNGVLQEHEENYAAVSELQSERTEKEISAQTEKLSQRSASFICNLPVTLETPPQTTTPLPHASSFIPEQNTASDHIPSSSHVIADPAQSATPVSVLLESINCHPEGEVCEQESLSRVESWLQVQEEHQCNDSCCPKTHSEQQSQLHYEHETHPTSMHQSQRQVHTQCELRREFSNQHKLQMQSHYGQQASSLCAYQCFQTENHSECLTPAAVQPHIEPQVHSQTHSMEVAGLQSPLSMNLQPTQSQCLEIKPFEWAFDDWGLVFPGAVSSPSDFWLRNHDESCMNHLHHIITNLGSNDNGSYLDPIKKQPVEGTFVAARTAGNKWFRGVVLEGNSSCVSVQDVDVGCVEVIYLDFLRVLPSWAAELHAQAGNCMLQGVHPSPRGWIQRTQRKFCELMELAKRQGVHAKCMAKIKTGKYLVELKMQDGRDVASVILEKEKVQHTFERKLTSPKSSVSSTREYLMPNVNSHQEKRLHKGKQNFSSLLDVAAKWPSLEIVSSSPSLSPDSSPPPPHPVLTISKEISPTFEMLLEAHIPIPSIAIDQPPQLPILISHVVSPDEIYVCLINEKGLAFNQMQEEMNDFYNKVDFPCPPISKVTLCSCWVARFSEDGKWYRAQVVEILQDVSVQKNHRGSETSSTSSTPPKFRMWYVDYGDSMVVSVEDMRPLLPEYASREGSVLCMGLAAIAPPSISHPTPEGPLWPPLAMSIIKEITTGNDVVAILLRREETGRQRRHISTLCNLQPYPVIMGVHMDGNEVVLNTKLVEMGVAETDGLPPLDAVLPDVLRDASSDIPANSSADPSGIESQVMNSHESAAVSLDTSTSGLEMSSQIAASEDDALEQWNPMAEQYYSSQNNTALDVEDIDVALTGHASRDLERACWLFIRTGQCNRPYCQYEHIKPDPSGITRDKEVVLVNIPELQLPDKRAYCSVEVSAIISPSHFYVIFPHGTACLGRIRTQVQKWEQHMKQLGDLDSMQKALQDAYKSTKFTDVVTVPALGEVLAVLNRNDGKWYRARVTAMTDMHESVRVFYADYGFSGLVHERDLRKLHKNLSHMPFQAVECFMSHVEPSNANKEKVWSQAARNKFKAMVTGNSLLVAHVISREASGALEVDLYTNDDMINEAFTLAHKLVNEGLAQWTKPKLCNYSSKPKGYPPG